MTNSLWALAGLALMTLVSNARADTVTAPGASGIRDQINSVCFEPNMSTGAMNLTGGALCATSYAFTIPVGKVIDSVLVGYSGAFLAGQPSIAADLLEHRTTAPAGINLIATASATPLNSGQLFLGFPAGGVHPVVSRASYWVNVATEDVGSIEFVSLVYH